MMNLRYLSVQVGAVLTFLLIPVWYRLPTESITFTPYYVARFLIFWTMLFTVLAWFASGLPGFATFRRDLLRAWWAIILLGLVIWMYASGAWAFMGNQQPQLAENATLQFGLVALFALAVACAGPPPRAVIVALGVGLVWNTLLAGAQVTQQGSIGLQWAGEFIFTAEERGTSVIQVGNMRWLRPYGLLPHSNILAGFFCISLLAMVYGLTSRKIRTAALSAVVFLPGLWVFFLTFSRGAFIAFISGTFVLLPMLLSIRRFNRWLMLLSICASVEALIFFITYQPLLLARTGVGAESTEVFSITERTYLNNAALYVINESTLLGVGMANFPWRSSYYFYQNNIRLRGNNVHHALMLVWAEVGIVGFIFVGAAIITGIEAAIRQIKSNNVDGAGRAVLLAGFIALAVGGLFEHYTWTILQFQVAWWGLLAIALQAPYSTSQSSVLESRS